MKFTVIWQSDQHAGREWIDEVFRPYIADHVVDGKRELVLDNAIVVDDFVYIQPREYYAKFRGKNAFLAHFQDEFYELGVDVYANFRGVFRAFWADIFNPEYIMRLPVGYTVGTRRQGTPVRASQRTYVWSFLGQMNKSSRPQVASALSRVEPHFLYSTDRLPGWIVYNRTSEGSRRLPREVCAGILAQSTFAPAPMGNAHVECYRPYEALEAGAIPILERRLTLDYYRDLLGPHPIPTVRSWNEARALIVDLLRQPQKLDELQTECMNWWGQFKQEYSVAAGEFLMRRSADRQPVPEAKLVTRFGRTRAWRSIELIRHHNASALVRRVGRQAVRLFTTGTWRVAYRRGTHPN